MTNATNRTTTPANYYGLFWRWHFFAALIVMPFVVWQSTTGTLYLWSQWWMDQAYPELRFVQPDIHTVPAGSQLLAALHSVPALGPALPVAPAHVHGPVSAPPVMQSTGRPVIDILMSDDPRRSTTVVLQGPNGLPYPVFVDPHTGHVLGSLGSWQWLPGWSRAMHGGWPLGAPGSWLLELGDCWAMVMILTGLYLWWPRGRGLLACFIPRLKQGTRTAIRDLHATIAVLFSAVFLFFLVSALPWTSFWGGQLLPKLEGVIGQVSPAGFSAGGASTLQMMPAAASLQSVVTNVRERDVKGMLDIRLSPAIGSRWWISNIYTAAPDHVIEADTTTGAIRSDFTNGEIPAIPRFVALGVHIHQADFGRVNLWLNTAFACSLIWLTVTGAVSWWIRRPAGRFGAPPKSAQKRPRGMVAGAVVMCAALPIFGISVALIGLAGLLARNTFPVNRTARATT